MCIISYNHWLGFVMVPGVAQQCAEGWGQLGPDQAVPGRCHQLVVKRLTLDVNLVEWQLCSFFFSC